MKMNSIIRVFVCTLALICVLCLLASCGSKTDKKETEASVQTAEARTESVFETDEYDPTTDELYDPDIVSNDISEHWDVIGGKYDQEFGTLVEEDYTDQFEFAINTNDEIVVRSPSAERCPGFFPTAAISAKEPVPLDGFSVGFHVDEGFTYSHVGQSYSSAFSVMWTDKVPTELCEQLDGPGTNGLRECLPDDVSGFCISFMGTEDTDGAVSNLVYIIRYDGDGMRPEIDSRLGYRFANWIDTDLSELTTVELNKDEDLGYVISVNGEELRTGTRGSDLYDIYLSTLRRIEDGYLTVGGTSNNYTDINFTLCTICGKGAGSYFD